MSCLPSQCEYRKPALAYREAGNGETVLLLHGSASSSALWRPTMAALAPLYRVVAPDLSGYGKSTGVPVAATYSVAAEAEALKRLLPCCDEAFHVVGHSFGGLVALQLAMENPARIRTLTLIEPVFVTCLRQSGENAAFGEFLLLRERFGERLGVGDHATAMREFMTFWNGEEAWTALTEATQAGMLSLADKIALDWQAAFAFEAPPEQLRRLANRTLLLEGGRSSWPIQYILHVLHSLMPEADRRVVAEANHLLPLTHAAAVTDAIVDHLHSDAERRLR